jgi:hypothetical protein
MLALTFARPRFELLDRKRALVEEALFGLLRPLGARLDRVERQSGRTPADASVEFVLMNYSLTVRVFVDRVEIQYLGNTDSAYRSLFLAAIACDEGLRKIMPDFDWEAGQFDVRLHTAQKGADDFIGRYAAQPPNLGVLLAKGVSFYFRGATTPAEPSATNLVVEPSALLSNGLFLRLWVTWSPVRDLGVHQQDVRTHLAMCEHRLGVKLLVED